MGVEAEVDEEAEVEVVEVEEASTSQCSTRHQSCLVVHDCACAQV